MQTLLRSLCTLSTAFFFSHALLAQCASTIINFPYEESFEDGFGDWTGDIANPGWQQTSNGTPSTGTGPTSAFDGVDYVYTETSQGANGIQDTLLFLNGPCFSFPTNSIPYIAFHYHMLTTNNADMGSLYLLADVDAGGTYDTLWSRFGNQGSAWLTDTVDLSDYSGQSVRLTFLGETGTSANAWRGDRAIDNIVVATGLETTDETCAGNDGSATVRPFFSASSTPSYTIAWPGGPTQTGVQEGTKSNISPGTYTVTITDNLSVQKLVDYTINVSAVQNIDELPHVVDFETGYGGWFNRSDDDFDWLMHQGSTTTGTTGPSGAAEGSRYLYTEANYSNLTNGGPQLGDDDIGIIESPCYTIPSSGAPYISMRYHMRAVTAAHMGSIFVRVQEVGTSTWDTLFSQSGNVSTAWQTMREDLTAYQGDIVRFQIIGQLGNIITIGGDANNDGDRAIDRIVVSNGVEVTDESCTGAADGSLTAYAAFGNGVAAYSWSNSATTQTINNLSAGTYTVTITSNTIIRIVTAEVGSVDVPSAPSITAATTTICDNSQDTIALSVGYPDNAKRYLYYSRALFSNVGPVQDTVQIQDPPKNPIEDVAVTYYYHGDINFEPSQFEILKLQDENNVTLIDSLVTTYQAWRNLDSAHTSISISAWEGYADDGLVVFRGVPNGNVNVAGLGHGVRWRAYVELDFQYSDFKPYWFTSASNTTIASAIDSGYALNVSPTTTTTYYVRYIDQECGAFSDADSITIEVVAAPTVGISPSNPFYCSTPVTITASGANSYVWSPGTGLNQTTGASVNASPAVTTSYEVIGTDLNGCSDTLGFDVTVTTGPSVTTTQTNVSCNGGNDGSITAIPSGGSGSYTYSWSNGDTTATINNLSAGTYTVTVNDGTTCDASTTVTLTAPSALSITIAGNNIGCSGFSTGSAFAFVTGGTPTYSYSWSNGSTNNVIFALAAGTYTLTVTDANGCTETDNVTITQPTSALTSSITSTTNVSCFGGNDGSATAAGSGGTPGYTYNWSNGANTATNSGLSAGNYIVTVVDANGCQSVSIATISQPATAVSVSISSSSNVTCNGGNDGSATALGSGGTGAISYAWSSGAATATATGLSAGTYTVTATDANGCTDTETVTITEPTAVTASFSSVLPSCNGSLDGSITATGSGGDGGPYSFAWNTGGTTATITGLGAGTYTVTITDNSGCTGTETTTLTEPTLLVASTVVDQNVSCSGGADGEATASATGGTSPYSFAWSSGGTTATETGLSAGTYTVTITDDNGCTDTIRLSTDIRYQRLREEIDIRWNNHWSLDDML